MWFNMQIVSLLFTICQKKKQLAYFEGYIANLKAAEEEAIKKEKEKITAGFASFVDSKGGKENKGKFYFYNITSLGYGKADFKNKWGDRELEDNWRWSSKNILTGRAGKWRIGRSRCCGESRNYGRTKIFYGLLP